MSSECYTATYTPESDITYDGLHGDRYTDLRWATTKADDDNLTAEDQYINVNNLDKSSPNLNVQLSNQLRNTSEQNPDEHAGIPNTIPSTSQTDERKNQNPCHESRKFIIATVTMTILSVLVISITTALTMTFASVTIVQRAVSALAGENKTLSCLVTGWCSSIYWEKSQGGLAVQIDVAASPSRTSGSTLRNPSLTLYNVSAHDEGVYRCVATSLGLMKKSKPITLKILGRETDHPQSNRTVGGSFTTSNDDITNATLYPTIAPPSRIPHTCQIQGGCTDPPKSHEGTACLSDFKNGRTSVAYSALERKSVNKFDHCPVSFCTHGSWSSFNISLSDKECFTVDNKTQAIYTGKNTCTVSGRTCQRWDRDSPHQLNPYHVPRDLNDLHSNYCRDEGPPYEGRPWCYTTDIKVRWEYCYVPGC